VSRKGHVGYYSGLEVVAFPRLRTLGELADHARKRGARFLYYSWYEVALRPEFSYLLDTTAAIPGLTVVHLTERRPSVVYRIDPGFGRYPPWMADPFLRAVHTARALVRVWPDSLAWSQKTVLAAEAFDRGRPEEALALAEDATLARPSYAVGWFLKGESLRVLHRNGEARSAYEQALALDSTDVEAWVGLGRVEASLGLAQDAARTWRNVAAKSTDVEALLEMRDLFERIGDRAGADTVSAALLRAGYRANPSPRNPGVGRHR